MNMIEKILSRHSDGKIKKPGETVDILIDVRAARDFGGAGVIRNLDENSLGIHDSEKTYFTFDCNPSGSDQKYAANQHLCRLFAREKGIRVFDINEGIGTHILMDDGIVLPGYTAVSTDSHANIFGAIGAFGQGMGDMDIAAAWASGKVWFRVPPSVKLVLNGVLPPSVSAKDIALNLLAVFGTSLLSGMSVEIYGKAAEALSPDQRITISSMATEMGAITILFPPADEIVQFCRNRTEKDFEPVYADRDAEYAAVYEINVSEFIPLLSRPGEPHNTIPVKDAGFIKIDSAFIGSCTNGRMEDMERSAYILRNRHVAPGVVLKIVPSTDRIWKECLRKGIIQIFKDSGALVSNAGCAGCAAGQVGQNGPEEITVSTGNRNFTGKQGKGDVWLASPEIVAASAIAGHIVDPDNIPEAPSFFSPKTRKRGIEFLSAGASGKIQRPLYAEGRVWILPVDDIDTDMIYHNRHLAVTDINEMGKYALGNMPGYENFASSVSPGDVIVAGRNFGCGSSRQQAVDCFISLDLGAIVARSFGAIWERNAINEGLPAMICTDTDLLALDEGDRVMIDFRSGEIRNLTKNSTVRAQPFSDIQMQIYLKGGLLRYNQQNQAT